MVRLEISILGTPVIRIDNQPLETDRRKAIALLAYLAVTQKSHTREHLATLFWPEYPRESSLAYLRRTIWELNKILGKGWISASRESVHFEQTPEVDVDTASFDRLISGKADDPQPLVEAVGLFRGDFMENFYVPDTPPFEEWQLEQAGYYRRELGKALNRLVKFLSSNKDYETALPYAQRRLSLDPINESAHRWIMRILAGLGDRAGAIRQYENCRRILRDELNIPVQPETEALYQTILRGELGSLVPEIDKELSSRIPVTKNKLPVMPTPFIGRREEVNEIKDLVKRPENRLITLAGPGGSGKTRMAIQVATEISEAYKDNVFFVPLAPVKSLDGVLPTLARVLEFSFYQEDKNQYQQILDFLREKELLLVLDNFEHLLEISGFVTEVLHYAPGVKLLVTSRIRLNIQGEQLYNVSGMRSPDPSEVIEWEAPENNANTFSAVQLFLDRAKRQQPDFTLTKGNVVPVAEICQLVQGMPLGLELAAAWLELLSPSEIVAEISRSLDFLETDQADLPERQRSIRAVFESSWKLLSDKERTAFLRLCVFVGSFSREAAQHISGASLRTLLGLANKSWLQQTEHGRFELHELMRQYGEERLQIDEAAWIEAKTLHGEFYTDFVLEQSQLMRGVEQKAGIDAMKIEFDSNIKAAWYWLVVEMKRWEALNILATGSFHFSLMLHQLDNLIPWVRNARLRFSQDTDFEGHLAFAILSTLEIFCEESSAIKDANPMERLEHLWVFVNQHSLQAPMGIWFILLGSMAHMRNIDPDVGRQVEKAVERIRSEGQQWVLGMSLVIQSWLYGEYTINEGLLLEASSIFEAMGVHFERGMVAEMLGRHAYQQKRPHAVVTDHFLRAKQAFEQLGICYYAQVDWLFLSGMYFQQGKPEEGFIIHKEVQRAQKELGNTRQLSLSLQWEGLHAGRYSTREHTLSLLERCLDMTRKHGSQSDLNWRLFELGEAYRIFGDKEKALELILEAETGFKKLNMIQGLGYCQRAYGDIALDEHCYDEAFSFFIKYKDLATRDNHAWSMAQADSKIALAKAYLDKLEDSREMIRETLVRIQDWGEIDLILLTLLAEPVCLFQEGRFKRSVQIAAFIANHPVSWNETRKRAQTILKIASQDLPTQDIEESIELAKTFDIHSVTKDIIES